jgi:hypothetical protein
MAVDVPPSVRQNYRMSGLCPAVETGHNANCAKPSGVKNDQQALTFIAQTASYNYCCVTL